MSNGRFFRVGEVSHTSTAKAEQMTDSEYLFELARMYHGSAIPEYAAHATRLTAIRHKLEVAERHHAFGMNHKTMTRRPGG